jgi:hypothetical protein
MYLLRAETKATYTYSKKIVFAARQACSNLDPSQILRKTKYRTTAIRSGKNTFPLRIFNDTNFTPPRNAVASVIGIKQGICH